MNSKQLSVLRRRVEMCRKATEHTLAELVNIQRLIDDGGMTEVRQQGPMTERDIVALIGKVLSEQRPYSAQNKRTRN